MILVIDAYNMLKQLVRERDISQSQRTQFVTWLKKYAQRKKHVLVVVFDGGPYQWVHKEHQGDMQVIYSGVKQTADDYISYYLHGHQHKDIVLVSADHELTLVASNLSIPSIAPIDFYALIQQALTHDDTWSSPDSQLVKMKEAPLVPDIDTMMEQASKVVPVKHADKALQLKQHIVAGQHKGSKIERKLLQVLKKL